ncbi:unnamed protein product [Prunus brigantina]
MDCEFRVRCRYHFVYLIGGWNGVNGDEAGFSIQMYHNGEIRGNYYVNGSVDWFDYCDKDRMSMTEIDAMVKELGHEGLINYGTVFRVIVLMVA